MTVLVSYFNQFFFWKIRNNYPKLNEFYLMNMIIFNNLLQFLHRSYGLGETKWVLQAIFSGFQKDCFRHQIQRIVSTKWSIISRNWESFLLIIGLPSKTSFKFYTGITGWENLKDIHRVFFHKFIGLLSESSISKSDPEELEMN